MCHPLHFFFFNYVVQVLCLYNYNVQTLVKQTKFTKTKINKEDACHCEFFTDLILMQYTQRWAVYGISQCLTLLKSLQEHFKNIEYPELFNMYKYYLVKKS